MADWYSTGSAAEKRVDDELHRQKVLSEERAKNYVNRLWLPAGGETEVTFVDEEKHPGGYPLPFVFQEHQLKLNGNWRNWFTCIGKGCPLCESGDKPYLGSAYTIVNHAEWTDKKNNVHKDELNLVVAKPAVNVMLRKSAARRAGLRGWFVAVGRTTDKSYSTGDVWDFIERREMKSDLQPLDYLEIFAPKSVEKLHAIFGGESTAVDADDSTIKF